MLLEDDRLWDRLQVRPGVVLARLHEGDLLLVVLLDRIHEDGRLLNVEWLLHVGLADGLHVRLGMRDELLRLLIGRGRSGDCDGLGLM